MDQKNTIVKCKAHPNCLFNYNGVCDNYVINIGVDGKCEGYVETENAYAPPSAQEILEYTIKLEQEKLMRGQRAKCDFYDDACDDKVAVKIKVAELNKPNKNKSTIKDVMPECDLPVCDWFCKHALKDGPSFNPYIWCDLYKMNPAMGLFCSLKEEKNEV